MKKLLFGFILIFNFAFADATKDLFEAIKKSDSTGVKAALSNNANPNSKDEKGYTPLDYLFDFDNPRDAKSLELYQELTFINAKYDIMKKLIDEEVNINYTKVFKDKILFFLVQEITKVSVMNTKEIINGNNDYTLEEKELLSTYSSFFKLLLDNNVNPRLSYNNISITYFTTTVASVLENQEGNEVLEEVTRNSVETLKQIIDLLLDKNVDYKECEDALLIFEVKVNNGKTVEKLLKNGAEVNVLIKDEFPLYIAAKNNSIEIMKLLINHGAYINGANNQGETPLYIAVVNNALEATKLLIEKRANLNIETENSFLTPLMVAINSENEERSKELIKLLIENGADVNYNISDEYLDYGIDSRFSPLCYANNVETIELLIKNGADVNSHLENGITVLMNSNSLVKEKILTEKGANINAIDNEKNSVLMSILTKNKWNEELLDMSKFLIDKGVDFKLSNNEGNDALMIASEIGLKELVKLLLEKGVDVKRKNNNGKTSLMFASASNSQETVQLLIEKGARINSVNNEGYNALMYAIETGNYEIVKFLLEKGADINSQTLEGVTPLKVAKLNGFDEIEKLLLEKGAK